MNMHSYTGTNTLSTATATATGVSSIYNCNSYISDGYLGSISDTTTTTTNYDKHESKPKKTSINLDIVDYKVINDKVVIVTFNDGSTEKSICHCDDVFALERAMELCICKKKFGGNKDYYAAIRKALKQVRDIDTKKKKDAEEKERIANRKAKYAERKAKRMDKKRKAQIDLQTESFVAAMMKYNEIVNDSMNAKASENKSE